MSENRLTDYIDHIHQAATDACSFTEGLAKDDFLADKRWSLILACNLERNEAAV